MLSDPLYNLLCISKLTKQNWVSGELLFNALVQSSGVDCLNFLCLHQSQISNQYFFHLNISWTFKKKFTFKKVIFRSISNSKKKTQVFIFLSSFLRSACLWSSTLYFSLFFFFISFCSKTNSNHENISSLLTVVLMALYGFRGIVQWLSMALRLSKKKTTERCSTCANFSTFCILRDSDWSWIIGNGQIFFTLKLLAYRMPDCLLRCNCVKDCNFSWCRLIAPCFISLVCHVFFDTLTGMLYLYFPWFYKNALRWRQIVKCANIMPLFFWMNSRTALG